MNSFTTRTGIYSSGLPITGTSGYPEKVLCTQYPSTRCSTHFFSPHDWEIHMKELLLSNGNGRVLGGKRGKRGTRLAKIPHPVMCSLFFFSNFPHQPFPKPLFLLPLCLFLGSHFLGVVRLLQCSTSPIRGRFL